MARFWQEEVVVGSWVAREEKPTVRVAPHNSSLASAQAEHEKEQRKVTFVFQKAFQA